MTTKDSKSKKNTLGQVVVKEKQESMFVKAKSKQAYSVMVQSNNQGG